MCAVDIPTCDSQSPKANPLPSVRQLAGIAQLVEQRTENPRVTGSNLVPGNTRKG